MILRAVPDYLEVLFEIQLEYAQRIAGVLDGRCDRHQRYDHVTLLDVVLDPLAVD